jgi:hypothetical protein
MNDELVYLAEDVRTEPLVNGFRAWPHLLPPHTYSLNLLTKHLPTLRRPWGPSMPRSCPSPVTAVPW